MSLWGARWGWWRNRWRAVCGICQEEMTAFADVSRTGLPPTTCFVVFWTVASRLFAPRCWLKSRYWSQAVTRCALAVRIGSREHSSRPSLLTGSKLIVSVSIRTGSFPLSGSGSHCLSDAPKSCWPMNWNRPRTVSQLSCQFTRPSHTPAHSLHYNKSTFFIIKILVIHQGADYTVIQKLYIIFKKRKIGEKTLEKMDESVESDWFHFFVLDWGVVLVEFG